MNVLVTGASGVVGQSLAMRFESMGFGTIRSGRVGRSPDWWAWDMSKQVRPPEARVDLILHTAPIWLLPENIGNLSDMGVKRIVCFSSTSAITKATSEIATERNLAVVLKEAESNVRAETSRFHIATTIFRPTMIYGFGRDRNISEIARFIRKYGFFPVAGRASGKRQPIHVSDLENASVSVLGNIETYGKTYNLAGGETLTYRTMVERIFLGLEKPVRIMRLPVRLYRGILSFAALLNKQIGGGMADRMNMDLTFDCREARDAFNFSPERFLEQPERDLPMS